MRRSRIRSIAAAVVAAASLVGCVAIASAHGPPQGSTVVDVKGVRIDPDNGFAFTFGRVAAQPQQCAKNRRVELQFNPGSGFETADTGRTTRRAYFGLAGPVSGGVNQIRVLAPKSKIKVGGNPITCKRAFGFAPE